MGGKSTRFGSEKWKAKLGNHIVLDNIWDACNIFKKRQLIGKKKPKQINKTFILDIYNYSAPIVGIHTAIANSKTNWTLVLSCDLPLINEECLKFIWDSKTEQVDAVVPIVKNRIQPLCSLYNINILDDLQLVYLLKKNSDDKFVFPYQELGKTPKREEFYFSEILNQNFLPERTYVPMNINDLSARQILKNLINKIKFRLKK